MLRLKRPSEFIPFAAYFQWEQYCFPIMRLMSIVGFRKTDARHIVIQIVKTDRGQPAVFVTRHPNRLCKLSAVFDTYFCNIYAKVHW